MADSQSTERRSSQALVEVHITPAIDREFERRQVFPDLRIAKAQSTAGIAGVFHVSPAVAAELLADVRIQYDAASRGAKKSYGALRRGLEAALGLKEAAVANQALAEPKKEPLQAVELPGPALSPDVKHDRYTWGDAYTGTKEALIAAGLAADGQFPGDPGRPTASCRYFRDGRPAQRGSRDAPNAIRRYGQKFVVEVGAEKEEEKLRLTERSWRADAAKAQAAVEKELGNLADQPATSKKFAKRAADLFWLGYNIFHCTYAGREPGDSGYAFKAADRDRILTLARRMFTEISLAKPVFNAERRTSKLNAARVNAAKVDFPLQRMLVDALSTAGKLPPETDETQVTSPVDTNVKSAGASH